MSEISLNTMRSAIATQSLATMGVDPSWDRCLSEYMAARTLADADEEFGALGRAQEAHEHAFAHAEAKFGASVRTNPDAIAELEQARRDADKAQEVWHTRYCEPAWCAARSLALHPAPTLLAVALKAQVIRLERLWDDSGFPHDAMDILDADRARLSPESADPDQAIMAAWFSRQVAQEAFDALPFSDAAEDKQAHLDVIDRAEAEIRSATATTPRGVAVQLLCSLSNSITDREAEAAITRADVAWFVEREREYDWSVRLVIAALRSLAVMKAVPT